MRGQRSSHPGWLPAAVVLGLLGGCATESKCGPEGCPDDAKITANVQTSFSQHPDLGSRIGVQTLDRVVYLTGYVSAGEMRAAAESIASATPGVKRVVDTISVAK
jgi:osmotically-inducible protein OsmY